MAKLDNSPKARIQSTKYLFDVLSDLQKKPSILAKARPVRLEPINIEQEIAREQKLKNDNAEQDIILKRETLHRLFRFLSVETALIFTLTFLQATRWPYNFHLEEWSFKLIIAATISQITGMLFVAVRYLFPRSQ